MKLNKYKMFFFLLRRRKFFQFGLQLKIRNTPEFSYILRNQNEASGDSLCDNLHVIWSVWGTVLFQKTAKFICNITICGTEEEDE